MLWAQIGSETIKSLPLDGLTSVDVFAVFSFAGTPLPAGQAQSAVDSKLAGPFVSFKIGKEKEKLSSTKDTMSGDVIAVQYDATAMIENIIPIPGVSLLNEDTNGVSTVLVEEQIVVTSGNVPVKKAVAKARIMPLSEAALASNTTIVIYAWTDYDKLGTATRFVFDSTDFTITEEATVQTNNGVFLRSGTKFDPTAGTEGEWQEVAPSLVGRSGPFCGTTNGKIYLIGGFNGQFTSANEEYDPLTNIWLSKTDMETARGFGSTIVDSTLVYCIGGYTLDKYRASEKVSRYDPSLDTWTELKDIPSKLAYGTAVSSASGIIYLLTGATLFDKGTKDPDQVQRMLSSVLKYDASSNTWTEYAPTIKIFTRVDTANPTTLKVVDDYPYPSSGTLTVGVETVGYTSYTKSTRTFTLSSAIGAHAPGEDVHVNYVYSTSTVTTSIAALAKSMKIASSVNYPEHGTLTVGSEIIRYYGYNTNAKTFFFEAPCASAHLAGETVTVVPILHRRMSANAYWDSTRSRIAIFNGAVPTTVNLGTFQPANNFLEYDPALNLIVVYPPGRVPFITTLPSRVFEIDRFKAGLQKIGTDYYVFGGSSTKSEWLYEVEKFNATGFYGPSGIAIIPLPLTDFGSTVATDADSKEKIYVFGGQGSGHPSNWLQVTAYVKPDSVRADGIQLSTITVSAIDTAGNVPEDGAQFRVRGYIYTPTTVAEKATQAQAIQSTTGEGQAEISPPPQKISILPVLFSSSTITMVDGEASTILLPRSDDFIKEVQNLFNYTKQGETVPSQEDLKNKAGETEQRNSEFKLGEKKNLYNVVIEISAIGKHTGTTDSDSVIATNNKTDTSLGFDGNFNFNPESAKSGLSATVAYYTDITAIPDVEIVAETIVAADAKTYLESMKDEVPYGASPNFQAIYNALSLRTGNNDVPNPPRNFLISVTDNEDNYSGVVPSDVVDLANSISGIRQFPIFIADFIVTDPISLAARRARTDVADQEYISYNTGGNSFSVVSSEYVVDSFGRRPVIDRILSGAPSSVGSGTWTKTHQLDGYLIGVYYAVSNLPPLGPIGNNASIEIWASADGYNYTQQNITIPPNTNFVFSNPIESKFVKYAIRLESKTFDTPILEYVQLVYSKPSIQYVFMYPSAVAGQVTELAAALNHRMPPGAKAEIGLSHGESLLFERDYQHPSQPTISDRGIVTAINRSFETYIDNLSTSDKLRSNDGYVWASVSGPWSQEAIARVFVNGLEAVTGTYIVVAEKGVVAFNKRLSLTDVVTLEVQNPSVFRLGIKISNPSLVGGYIDEVGYMWGTSEDPAVRLKINRPPRAVSLTVTPSPVLPGGPLVANYTFVDPDGDEEDIEKTQIVWYRDGVPIPELNNMTTITNSDLIATRPNDTKKIEKNQQWFFSVRPSDGRAYGPLVISPTYTIANSPPTATNVKLKTSNTNPEILTSSDTVTAVYDISDADSDKAGQSIYTWFVNGVEVKTGTENTIASTEKDEAGQKLLSGGNTIYCNITPFDGTDYGPAVDTNTLSVSYSIPVVSTVAIAPKTPSLVSTLVLTYKYKDVDGNPDKSTIAWYRNNERVSELENLKQIPPDFLAAGQEWYAVVTPYNGQTEGTAVKSSSVMVRF